MDRNQLVARLMVTFLGEVEEHLLAINTDLLALEKQPIGPGRDERYRSLFRAAHSMKGAARSVDVNLIEEACHHLEEVLGDAREGLGPLDADQFALLFETADAIHEAARRLRDHDDLAESPLYALLPRLAAAARAARPSDLSPLETEPDRVPIEAGSRAAVPSPSSSAGSFISADLTKDQGFVRVPAEKLDALLTRSGELLVARRQVEAWADNMAELREFVLRWKGEWRCVLKPLGKLLAHDQDGKRATPTVRHGGGTLPRRAARAMRQVSDNLGRLEKNLDRFAAVMAKEGCHLNRAATLVDEEARRVRMFPFVDACQGLERTVRDVARAGNKDVELIIEGGDLELDRSVLEGLKDPLSHLVRNAVDHGLETSERRRQAGKSARGRITVSAALQGPQVEVIVADDGQGLDSAAIRLRARKQGLAEPPDNRGLAQLIFHPGFSTAPIITHISGRGVGLDVVKSRVEALRGSIDVRSEPGRGTRFTLTVPLTLTTLRVLLVSAGGQTFALASANVRKLLRADPRNFRSVRGREMLALGGPLLPVASLGEALGGPPRAAAASVSGKLSVVVVAAGDLRMAFVVDELLDEREVLVKGLGPRVRRTRDLSGATILPSGRIALVLNIASLVRTALGQVAGPALARAPAGTMAAPKKRLLVVDDSITTRTLEKSILEAAGYEVATAVDGEDGWRLLQEHGADLLLSDIEMPRMDGFDLTEVVRASKRFSNLPIVLFTSLGRESDRARGIEVGADAYIVKGAFDQKDLVETISQLL